MTTDRLIRADAARNREKILDTARSQIATHGPDVSVLEIANAAGVAVGTLYRHFPTKTDLVSAVIAEHIERLATMIERSLSAVESGAADAATELLEFLQRILEGAANNPALKAAAATLPVELAHSQTAMRAFAALDRLVAAGCASGRLRADLGGNDIVLLACTGPFDQDAPARARWLELVWPGLLAKPTDFSSARKG